MLTGSCCQYVWEIFMPTCLTKKDHLAWPDVHCHSRQNLWSHNPCTRCTWRHICSCCYGCHASTTKSQLPLRRFHAPSHGYVPSQPHGHCHMAMEKLQHTQTQPMDACSKQGVWPPQAAGSMMVSSSLTALKRISLVLNICLYIYAHDTHLQDYAVNNCSEASSRPCVKKERLSWPQDAA